MAHSYGYITGAEDVLGISTTQHCDWHCEGSKTGVCVGTNDESLRGGAVDRELNAVITLVSKVEPILRVEDSIADLHRVDG